MANPFKKLFSQLEDRRKNKAIAEAEILHGQRPPPPPGMNKAGVTQTFAQPPKLRKPSVATPLPPLQTLKDIKRSGVSREQP
jgi:hypothetical protein